MEKNPKEFVAAIECTQCCATIKLDKKGHGKCDHCGHEVFPKNALDKSEAVKRINIISQKRNDGLFDDALGEIQVELECGNKSVDLYLAKLYCVFGVRFVDDGDGKLVPTISRLSSSKLKDHDCYQLAIEQAKKEYQEPDDVIREIEETVDRIDDIRQKALEASQKISPYDIFICFKQRSLLDKTAETEDCRTAEAIYDRLTDLGYKVFFSKKSLKAGEEYEPIIYRALSTAKVMLVVSATKPRIQNGIHINYVEEPWVKNEWSRFIGMINEEKDRGTVTKHLIPVFGNEVVPDDLPREFNKFQGLKYDGVFFDKLSKQLEEYCPTDAGSKFAKNNVKKRDVQKVEIEKKVIVRKSIGSKGGSYTLTPAIQQVIDSATDDIKSGSFEHARIYLRQKLESKEFAKDGQLNWLAFKAYMNAKSIKDFEGKKVSFSSDEQKDEIRKYLVNSIEGDGVDDKTANEVFNAVAKIAEQCIIDGKISEFNEFYNFLTNYLSEKETLKFGEQFARLADERLQSKEEGLGKFSKDKLTKLYFDVLYDSLAIGGTDKVIEIFDSVARTLNYLGEYELSNIFTDKVLELYELNVSGIFLRLMNNFGLNRFKPRDPENIIRFVNNEEQTHFCAQLEKAMQDTASNPEFEISSENENDNIFYMAFSFVNDYIHNCSALETQKGFEFFKLVYSYVPSGKKFSEMSKDYCSYFAIQFLVKNTDEGYQITKDICQEYISSYGTNSFDVFMLQLLADLKMSNIFELFISGIDFEMPEKIEIYDSLNTASYSDSSKKDPKLWKKIVTIIKEVGKRDQQKTILSGISNIMKETHSFMDIATATKACEKANQTYDYTEILSNKVVDGYIACVITDFLVDYRVVNTRNEKLELEGQWTAESSERERKHIEKMTKRRERKKAVTSSAIILAFHLAIAAFSAFLVGKVFRDLIWQLKEISQTKWSVLVSWTYYPIFLVYALVCAVVGAALAFGLFAIVDHTSDTDILDSDGFLGFLIIASAIIPFFTAFGANAQREFPILAGIGCLLSVSVYFIEDVRNGITTWWMPLIDAGGCFGLLYLGRTMFN